jgi:hypothetical protein
MASTGRQHPFRPVSARGLHHASEWAVLSANQGRRK